MDHIKRKFRFVRHKIIRWWRIHTVVPRLLRYNPYTGFIGRRLFQYIPFLLPHDKSYYGFIHLVNEGDGLFLDVGANDGISAIGFRHVHSDYRILSIEPNLCHEAHLKNLKKRLKRFDYLLAGAGRERLKMTLYIPVFNSVPIYTGASLKKDHALRTMHEQHIAVGEKNIVILEHTVDILPLDDLNLDPDVIKIDTEGYDYEVLLGMKATIERCRPVILIEYIPEGHPLVKDFFENCRYDLWTYDHARDTFFAFDEKEARPVRMPEGDAQCVLHAQGRFPSFTGERLEDNMFYFIFALLLFITSVIVHIFFCRKTHKPGLHAKAFILTVLVFLGIYAGSVLVLQQGHMLDPHSLWGLPFKITAGTIFILLAPIYLCFYVLTQLTSPSKKILSAIFQGGELSYEDILAAVQKEDFIMTRLSDLCTSKCVAQVNGRYVLTAEGQKIAATLNVMQLMLGRNVGG